MIGSRETTRQWRFPMASSSKMRIFDLTSSPINRRHWPAPVGCEWSWQKIGQHSLWAMFTNISDQRDVRWWKRNECPVKMTSRIWTKVTIAPRQRTTHHKIRRSTINQRPQRPRQLPQSRSPHPRHRNGRVLLTVPCHTKFNGFGHERNDLFP